MDTYLQQAKDWWNRWQGMSGNQKTAWVFGTLFCWQFVGLLYWVSRPEYRSLYTGLSAEEAGAITTKLRLQGRAIQTQLRRKHNSGARRPGHAGVS